jgi:hypothetical protein
MLRRFNAWLETLEPSKAWTVAAVVFLIAFVLAGLGFALFNGAQ